MVVLISDSQEDQAINEARLLAIETGEMFSYSLDQAIAPLFSLAQFVQQLSEFDGLAETIGPAGEPGSAPLIPRDDGVPSHRNVTGICDDGPTLARFNEIAADIKRNAGMEKVLVNLQIAPHAVVCMLYPKNNTEDFEDGIFMDNSGAIGHDLLEDPARKFIAQATVPADSVVIAGPLTLKQCDPDCHPTVEKAFIARLPIASDHHTIDVDGKTYNRWGFAVALINWAAMVERSNIQTNFAQRGYSFQLTRTDQKEDPETGVLIPKVVTLAESPNFKHDSKTTVAYELETTNNAWVIQINYCEAVKLEWRPWAFVLLSIFSLCFAMLAYTVLLQKQIHSDMDAEKTNLLASQAQQAAANQRDLNEYLAHEVRNPLSAALSACTFVLYALEEEQTPTNIQGMQEGKKRSAAGNISSDEEAPPAAEDVNSTTTSNEIVTKDKRLSDTVSGDVHIIETSLRFINELLRSILDMNRAQNNQMTLENEEVDVFHDLFEPVSSMIYKRDGAFEFLVECPENLIILGDKLRLQQVILNLCRNSTKFVTEGFVRVRAQVLQFDGKSKVCLFVEDSGPGIPPEKRKDLFRRFQESLDTLGQGTGVGLNLSRKIVDLMGGSMYVDERYKSGVKGQPGTRIVIELNRAPIPARNESTPFLISALPQRSATPRFSDEGSGTEHFASTRTIGTDSECTDSVPTTAPGSLPPTASVLFVDDDRIIRKLASRAMAKALPGWLIREAASGETALSLTEAQDFDIIFMDQYMASVDQALKGTETVRAMRAKGVKSVICGLSANNIEEQFLEAGADAFLLKPFPCKVEEALHAVEDIWNSRGNSSPA